MRNQSGFTLIELLVVMVIAAILAMLAAPSLTRFVRVGEMTSAVNTFMADLRFARSEAIRRGGNVVMCRSNSPEAASPVCNTSAGGTSGNGWVSGWIVFHDLNGDGSRTSTEPLLRVQVPLTSVNSILESSSSTKFRFTATGRLMNPSLSTTLQFGSNPPYTNDLQRVVCVNVSGRARIAGDGTSNCAGG